MSITFSVEAHTAAELTALTSENAPTLNVHNTGGYVLLAAVLGITPDYCGGIDPTDLIDRIDHGPHSPVPDHPGPVYVADRLPSLRHIAVTAARLDRQVVWS